MNRCAGQLRDGTTCLSAPVRGSDFCAHHAAQAERQEKVLRTVRDRLADDAAEDYEKIRQALYDAIAAETTRWGDCPGCGKRVGVHFPDFQARTKAIALWLDQGFGRPATTVAFGESASVTAGLSDKTKATLLEALAELEDDPPEAAEESDPEEASRQAGGRIAGGRWFPPTALSTNGKDDA